MQQAPAKKQLALKCREAAVVILYKLGLAKAVRAIWHRFLGLTNYRHAKRLCEAKYIHLMFNDKFNKPFVAFLNKYFNQEEHIILCKRCCLHPFPVGDNVIEVKSFHGFDFSKPNIRQLIFHSFCDDEMVDILYENKKWLSKSCWLIFGGDLYDAVRNIRNDYVRSHVGTYVVVAENDGSVAFQRYNSNAKCFHVCYNVPISWSMIQQELDMKCKCKNKSIIRIQINNSCEKSTIEMLHLLAKYRSHNIEVCTILSYGHLEYRDTIIATGKELFGTKFLCALTFMPPEEYVAWMANVNVLILNQDRQQGLGNISLALALGAKCFAKSTTSSYSEFAESGLHVYDTLGIAKIPYDKFIRYEESVRSANMRLSAKFYDDALKKEQWRAIFSS